MTDYAAHIPVLKDEAIALLNVKPGDTAVDGTLGAGGYTEALLQAVGETGHVVSFDLDPEAIAHARERFQVEITRGRLHLVHGNFARIKEELENLEIETVQAIVLDLGLSTHHLEAARGFAYAHDAPLDMRFNLSESDRPTAAQLLSERSEADLAALFVRYGDLRNARPLAAALTANRRERPVLTSGDLATIARAVPHGREREEAYLAKVFQALRIAVNGEQEALEAAVPEGIAQLAPNGRIVVVSYHSLEDRIVKQVFRREATGCLCPPEVPVCICGHRSLLRILTPTPLVPSLIEVETNPKSRSAKLRAAERLSHT